METENPYVEQPERQRYQSDRLNAVQLGMHYCRAAAEGTAWRRDENRRVPTRAYVAQPQQMQGVAVAEPVSLEDLLPRPVA